MKHKYKPGAHVAFYVDFNNNIRTGIVIKRCDYNFMFAYEVITFDGIHYGVWDQRMIKALD